MKAYHNPWRRVKILWSRNVFEPDDYYADKLILMEHEDTKELMYELRAAGRVVNLKPGVVEK